MLNSIWIELHQEMPRHPKTLALAQTLKVSRRETVGILVDLWTWGLSCADEDGNLKAIGQEGIALALDWPVRRAGKLVDAFVACQWLDSLGGGKYRLHDWPDYTGRLSEKRKDAERKRQARKRGQSPANPLKSPKAFPDNPANIRGLSPDSPIRTVRAGLTLPHQTEPNRNNPGDKNTPSFPTEEEAKPDGGAEQRFGRICQEFEEKVKPMPSSKDGAILSELFRDYPEQSILDAISETARCRGRSASYVRSVLLNAGQKAKGPPVRAPGPDLSDPERYKNFGK